MTGKVVNATDPEGDPLTYTVAANPAGGKVTIDQATGSYTYTYTYLIHPDPGRTAGCLHNV